MLLLGSGFVWCPSRATGHLLDCPRPEPRRSNQIARRPTTNFWPKYTWLSAVLLASVSVREVCRVFPNCYFTFSTKFLNAPKADMLPKVFLHHIYGSSSYFPVHHGMAASGYLARRMGSPIVTLP